MNYAELGRKKRRIWATVTAKSEQNPRNQNQQEERNTAELFLTVPLGKLDYQYRIIVLSLKMLKIKHAIMSETLSIIL